MEERIQAGITFAKSCFLINKLPGSVVAVYGQKKGTGNTDTVRVIMVENDPKSDDEKYD